jgi:hypothetical protein
MCGVEMELFQLVENKMLASETFGDHFTGTYNLV